MFPRCPKVERIEGKWLFLPTLADFLVFCCFKYRYFVKHADTEIQKQQMNKTKTHTQLNKNKDKNKMAVLCVASAGSA